MMNLFRRPSVRYGATPEPETPYQRAAQVWDKRIGSAEVRSYRSVSKGSNEVSFELGFRLAAPTAAGTGVKTAKKGASDATT